MVLFMTWIQQTLSHLFENVSNWNWEQAGD